MKSVVDFITTLLFFDSLLIPITVGLAQSARRESITRSELLADFSVFLASYVF